MEYFLESIAASLYKQYGNTLDRHCLVFPNRRAGLFFLKYLAARIEKPVWEPSVLTINELFRTHSVLQAAGNEILLFELYKVYNRLCKSSETFDSFYFWGDMLLNDFDDIDKYLVDASLLFKNVQDIKNIDQQFGGLTEFQTEIIRKFWINFNPEKLTVQKSGFLGIWSVLDELYREFRNSLLTRNLAYEGMIFRDLAENDKADFSAGGRRDLVHFIGFNALNESEKRVMLRLKKAGKALFYWDFDESYISETGSNSAGFFMRENLKLFENSMPSGWSYRSLISSPDTSVKRRVFDTSSDVAQVKLVPDLLKELPGLSESNAHQTAVILADESLLVPMLSSLPENMGDVNITMGYPLKQTQVYALIKSLMDLQRNAFTTDGITRFGFRDVSAILKNPLISSFIPGSPEKILNLIIESNLITVPSTYFEEHGRVSLIFIKPDTPPQLSDYFRNILSLIASSGQLNGDNEADNDVSNNILNEFIYRVVLSVNRLEAIVRSGEVVFSNDTYMRILDRMLRLQSVPFAGEPLSGIQIMGILETRALDFKNLIILSVNEGILPSVSSPSSSFIPFSLREAFRLPSVNHQESVYAYHFYRLLQRAENVTFIYNSNPEGLKSGEMSRFLIQMNYNPLLKPEFLDISMEVKSHGSISETLERREEHLEQLKSQYLDAASERLLSPSAINTWLGCRMKFYYRYVNHLKEPSEIRADIDPAMLGSILHEIMKSVYIDFEGRELKREFIESLLDRRQELSGIIEGFVRSRYSSADDTAPDGNEIIVRDVLLNYLTRILNTDKALAPLKLIALERRYSFPLSLTSGGKEYDLLIGGVVDRIDIVNGTARIVDYKTGAVADILNSLSDIFEDDRKKDADGWLQTLLYCEALFGKIPVERIRPSIYKIKKTTGGSDSDMLRIRTGSRQEMLIEDYLEVREHFIDGLKETVSRIFSEDEPFYMTEDRIGKCRYCPYRALCMR
jgi:CRISPR/Cas system-associated exonuclease Cas4 (RecB family)